MLLPVCLPTNKMRKQLAIEKTEITASQLVHHL